MLSPRLTNCPECADIPSLLRKIDCKLAELGNNLYNNISYMLNKSVPADDITQLIGYRRILMYKLINPNYVHKYSVAMISSRVIRLTLGCVSRCNTPEPCIEVPCDITIVTNPTTTTTTTFSGPNYNVAGCERMEYHVIHFNGVDELGEGTIVSNFTPECWYIIDVTTDPADVGTIDQIYGITRCENCINQYTTTTTTTTI